MIRIDRANQALEQVNLILTALVPMIGGRARHRLQQQWAIPAGVDPPADSIWTQSTYRFGDFARIAARFDDSSYPQLEIVPDDVFYGRPGFFGYHVLVLPTSIGAMLDRFYALDRGRRERFQRWAYWLNHSRLVGALSMSAAYMAVIQSIEALRPEIAGGPACPVCARRTGPGPTRQFADFVDRYVPRQDGESERERTKLYGLRSGLTHGGKLMEGDLGRGFGEFHPGPLAEQKFADRAEQLARLAGVNWLLAGGP